MNSTTQLLIIGAGPGGYTAAFLAADYGMDITLVDQSPAPGGVCLQRGCIPSKALLHATKIMSDARKSEALGITFEKINLDLEKLRIWKNNTITKLTQGLTYLCQQRKVRYVQGKASFTQSNTVLIEKPDGSQETISFEKAILATGSSPVRLPDAPNSSNLMDSTAALNIEDVPPSLLIIGGGYIGLELGCVYAGLGSAVSVIEMTETLLPGVDRDLVRPLEKNLKRHFNSISLKSKVTAIEPVEQNLRVTSIDKKGKTKSQEYDKVLIAIGRRPNTQGFGLENTKITPNQRAFIPVNAQGQTDDPAIYAIGDITGEPMLAHKAAHEGRNVVETICGKKSNFTPTVIPAVVFTHPEIAWCGLTETQAAQANCPVTITKFPWTASGRALTLNNTDGLTKLVIDPQTRKILGVGISGPGAGELIAEGVLAVEMGATADQLKSIIHPHPTLSETLMESAETFFGQSTHTFQAKK